MFSVRRRRRYTVVYKYFVWEIFIAEGLELRGTSESFARFTGRTPRVWIRAFLTF